MYLNIRGIKSKIRSLNNIVEEVQPTIICITESHLMDEEDLQIDGYKNLRNDRNKDGGGVLIAVQEKLYNITTIVEKMKDVEESIWVVINNTCTAIRIGLIYAPQESRTTKEEYQIMYENISKQITIAKEKEQKLLLMGDFNCKVGEIIVGNGKEITKSAKNFLKMIKSNKLTLLNAAEKCSGLWTRIEGTSRSVLDYVVTQKEDEHNFIEMRIDETKELAPTRDDNDGGTTSDHNTIVAKFNWLVDDERKKTIKPKKIITRKGYTRIKEEMQEVKPSRIWMKEKPFEELYDEWKGQINQIIERNSTVLKKINKRKDIKELIKAKRNLKNEAKTASPEDRYKIVGRIKMVDKAIKDKDREQHNSKINKVVSNLKSKNGLNIPNMWEIVKKIKRKKEEPRTAVKSKDGTILEDPEQIKTRYLEHFCEILKNKPAVTEKQKKQEKLIDIAFNRIMTIADNNQTVLTTREEIEAAVSQLKKKKCKDKTGWNNEIILESGKDMIDSLLAMINKMEKERSTPKQWAEMKIKAISKPGSVLLMDNKRGLFITDVISKLYEKVLKNRNEEKIYAQMSDFQAGGMKMRSTGDCLFLTSEIIRTKKKAGKKCYLVFGDAVKCFDKLWLRDSLVDLFKAGCEPQDIQMMYKMNENTVIEVETPCGTTEKITVGEIVKQGTVLGPTLCCVSTDQINKIGESQERNLGKEYMAILVFVDDVMSAGNAEEVRKAIRNFKEMEELKKFTYGLKKTKFMVMNTGKEKEEMIDEEVGLGKITKTTEYKYVGFHLNEKGNCLHHIEQKDSKVAGQINAIRSIANSSNVGSKFLAVRLELYESCFIHSLLHGMEAWHEHSKTEIKNLEKIQSKALCQLLHLPRSTPYLGLLNELGMWRMQERIDYRRVMFLQNILKSDDRRLVKRIVLNHRQDEEDGTFYQTTREILESYKIDPYEIEHMSKSELKKMIKTRIEEKMETLIKEASKKMTKLRFTSSGTEFKRKRYIIDMNGSESLHTLKTRLNMLPVSSNFKSDVNMDSWCSHCKRAEDTTEHLVECPALGETFLRKEDLKSSDNTKLWKVINERTKYNLENRKNAKEMEKESSRDTLCYT